LTARVFTWNSAPKAQVGIEKMQKYMKNICRTGAVLQNTEESAFSPPKSPSA
jgi:hypothetical protein